MSSSNFPSEYRTTNDKEFLEKRPNYVGLYAAITDTAGNYVYFKEDGSITEDPNEGRVVYQYLRRVFNDNGKLYLSSRSNRLTSLIDAETIVQRKKALMEASGKEVSKDLYDSMVKEEYAEQQRKLNELLRLREYLVNGGDPVILPITGGSFGINSERIESIPFLESGLSEKDLQNYETITSGALKGWSYFTVQTETPGATIDQDVFIQRGDFDEALAEKVSTILTTTAKFKGKELTPQERQSYFEIFVDNSIPEKKKTNREDITVKTKKKNNKYYLEVKIKGEVINPEELYTEESKAVIKNYLLNKKEISGKIIPVSVHYNNDYRNEIFYDYVVEGDKIKQVEKDYFNFIKPYMKITYTNEDDAYFNGLNAYLSYSIPKSFIKPGDTLYEVGQPVPKKGKTSDKKATRKAPAKNVGGAKVIDFNKFADAKEAVNKGEGIWSMRPTPGLEEVVTFDENFGNPWSTKKDKLNKYVKIVDTVEEAVKNYEDWLKGKAFVTYQKKRRAWILDQIKSGNLDNATFVYYKPGKYKSHVDVLVDLINKRDRDNSKPIPTPVVERTTPQQKKELDKKVLSVNSVTETKGVFDDIFKATGTTNIFKRALSREQYLDKVFTSKADLRKAEEWFKNSELSKIKINGKLLIPLERITEIVNSDAFATFSKYGITLYEADGGTAVDLYHEAWHGFSQLVLSYDQKVALYEELRTYPKWNNAEFLDIEEDIAEDFRSFMKSKKKFPGLLGKIFEALGKLLRAMYGKITRQDMLRPRDIASVKEYFDILYKSDTNPEVFQQFTPSMDNMYFTQTLNRAKSIQPVKSQIKNYAEFTQEESMEVANTMDNIIGIIFRDYNADKNSSSGALRILSNPENRINLYHQIRVVLENLKNRYIELGDPANANQLLLLEKVLANYGDINKSLDKTQRTGVVAFHIQRSKFNLLKESYVEVEDPSNINNSLLFKLDGGNRVSSKELASQETLTILSSIFKVTKDEEGNLITETDYFGAPQLEDSNNMWNRLAKILQGSFDEMEMYQRLVDNVENYPELQQLLNLLPNPFKSVPLSNGQYQNSSDFRTETNFWQDLKKPRISYVQLNIEKSGSSKDTTEADYEAKVSKANFDVSSVINDWTANFIR
jgi:hypothetical protein